MEKKSANSDAEQRYDTTLHEIVRKEKHNLLNLINVFESRFVASQTPVKINLYDLITDAARCSRNVMT